MTKWPKIPPGFRDVTTEGAAIAVIGGMAAASGARTPSEPTRKPQLRPPKGGIDRTHEPIGEAFFFVGAEAFRRRN